jgi:hypothetical protein
MIDNYDEVMAQWAAPSAGCCSGSMTITPAEDFDRWAVQQTITILANADYYYTKTEVDNIISQIIGGSLTPEEVQAMIDRSIAGKADQSEVDTLAAQVRENTEKILNTYTKPEVNALLASYYTKIQTNNMFANYSKVENSTLILNSENIN